MGRNPLLGQRCTSSIILLGAKEENSGMSSKARGKQAVGQGDSEDQSLSDLKEEPGFSYSDSLGVIEGGWRISFKIYRFPLPTTIAINYAHPHIQKCIRLHPYL